MFAYKMLQIKCLVVFVEKENCINYQAFSYIACALELQEDIYNS